MKQYYYLICSLPFIKLEETPSINSGEFRRLCQEQISEKDLQLLDAVSLVPAKDSPFAKDSSAFLWLVLETNLRKRMAIYRAGRKSGNTSRSMPKGDNFSDIDQGIQEAYAKSNPAEREKHLDSLRWHWLDELEFGHYFDVNKLFIYKLRLLIHEKWLSRNNEHGYENFDRIVAAINDSGEFVDEAITEQN
jgi:hypothetical protein